MKLFYFFLSFVILLSSSSNSTAQTVNPLVEETVTEENDSTEYEYVDEWPEFKGGQFARNSFLAKNIQYPREAEKKGIEGRVIIAFVIEKDGAVTHVEIIKSVHPLLDNEALRVVKLMPNWKPGISKGKLVRCKFKTDIIFKLPE